MRERVIRTKDEIKSHLQTIVELVEKECGYYSVFLERLFDNESKDVKIIKRYYMCFDNDSFIAITLNQLVNGYTLMVDYTDYTSKK